MATGVKLFNKTFDYVYFLKNNSYNIKLSKGRGFMEKFKFDYYKDSIKKIKCIYNYNDNVGENTFWEGYIITRNIDGVLDIEGYEVDNMDSLEKDGSLHKRYILGKRSISYANESLSFELYPGNIAPIHYDMYYNFEDGCFYGNWFFLPSENHSHPHEGKGEAIILIEDAMVEEKEITKIIEQIANRSRREYCKEIETYEFLAHNQFLPFDNDNSSAFKRLSKFSSSMK